MKTWVQQDSRIVAWGPLGADGETNVSRDGSWTAKPKVLDGYLNGMDVIVGNGLGWTKTDCGLRDQAVGWHLGTGK